MSNNVPRLLLLAALSLSVGTATAANWRDECGKMSQTIPGACTEIEKTVSVLDVYKPPQAFLEYQLQTYAPGSDAGTPNGASSGKGGAEGSAGQSNLLETYNYSTEGAQQDSGSGTW